MIKKTLFLCASLLLFVSSTGWAVLPAMVNDQEMPSLAPLVERVSPAVVNIRVSQTVSAQHPFGDDAFRRFFGIPDGQGGTREVASAGSGVIVDADNGYIITNHHVVANADQIQISTIDGEIFDAEIVGSDAATDIAVIKVDASGLTDMPIGDSEGVRVGDFVLAIGNPFGLGHTVTSGIVSALGRTGISRDGYEDFIQTDASINPGNSGGALVNLRGELVGINSAILSRTGGNVGIGFAVPIDTAVEILPGLREGKVVRGRIGVTVWAYPFTPEDVEQLGLPRNGGAEVTEVTAGPAREAGIRVGDVIIEYGGTPVNSSEDLVAMVTRTTPGTTVPVRLVRNREQMTLNVTIEELDLAAERQAVAGPTRPSEREPVATGFGMTLGEVTPGIAQQLNVPSGRGGALITQIDPAGSAAAASLQRGDVILSVNGLAVSNLDEAADALDATDEGRTARLIIWRQGRELLVRLRKR